MIKKTLRFDENMFSDDQGGIGLLQQFINKKIGSHVNPERKGSVRGERIGDTKERLAAAGFSLTNLTGKRISELLNLSYNSLRQWKTQLHFNELIERIGSEFASVIVDRLLDFSIYERQANRYVQGAGIILPSFFDAPTLLELSFYSDELCVKITNNLEARIDAMVDDDLKSTVRFWCYILFGKETVYAVYDPDGVPLTVVQPPILKVEKKKFNAAIKYKIDEALHTLSEIYVKDEKGAVSLRVDYEKLEVAKTMLEVLSAYFG